MLLLARLAGKVYHPDLVIRMILFYSLESLIRQSGGHRLYEASSSAGWCVRRQYKKIALGTGREIRVAPAVHFRLKLRVSKKNTLSTTSYYYNSYWRQETTQFGKGGLCINRLPFVPRDDGSDDPAQGVVAPSGSLEEQRGERGPCHWACY